MEMLNGGKITPAGSSALSNISVLRVKMIVIYIGTALLTILQ